MLAICGCDKESEQADKSVILAQQTWTEASVMADLLKIIIQEKTDIPLKSVDLESEIIQWQAMQQKEVDIWPTYISTLYTSVLKDTGLREPDKVYEYVNKELPAKYDMICSKCFGFSDEYGLAATSQVAEKYDLHTFSDLAKVAGELVLVSDINFMDRPDGFPLIKEKYEMDFKEVKNIGINVKYQALKAGEADIVACYITDAKIDELGLVLLEDDQNAMIPSEGLVLLRGEIGEKYPELEEAINSLAGQISTKEMRNMNYQVEVERKESKDVARDFLKSKGLI